MPTAPRLVLTSSCTFLGSNCDGSPPAAAICDAGFWYMCWTRIVCENGGLGAVHKGFNAGLRGPEGVHPIAHDLLAGCLRAGLLAKIDPVTGESMSGNARWACASDGRRSCGRASTSS